MINNHAYGPGHTHNQYLATLAAGHETGWWNQDGHPAPWPEDIDEWTPETNKINNPDPEQPF